MGSTGLLTPALSHLSTSPLRGTVFSPVPDAWPQGEPDQPGLQQRVTPDSFTPRRMEFPVQAAGKCLSPCGIRETQLPMDR